MLHASYMSKKSFLPLEEHAEVGGKRPSVSSFRVRVRGRSGRSPRLGLKPRPAGERLRPPRACWARGWGAARSRRFAPVSVCSLLTGWWFFIQPDFLPSDKVDVFVMENGMLWLSVRKKKVPTVSPFWASSWFCMFHVFTWESVCI